MTANANDSASEPRVGVVIPVYNTGSMALGAARSARRALGGTANIVVVDDGSTDRSTRRALSTLAAEGFWVIRQPNAGVSAARNAGIAQLATPYVVALDSDDEMLPGVSTRMADLLEASPEAAVVSGGGIEMSGGIEISGARRAEPVRTPQPVTRCAMRNGSLLATASMFRRRDWEAVGGFPEGLAIGEDWVFWMRLLRDDGEVLSVDEPIVRRHLGRHQATHGYIDLRHSAAARAMILREHPDLFTDSPDELLERTIAAEQLLAEYRHAYRHVDRAKRSLRRLLRR